MGRKMLEKLDQVDWDSLSGTYGSVANVPQLIRRLLSEDETEWERAYYDLDSLIWHQGTVYEATAYVIPFLAELLECESVINRDWILMGLIELANGHSYFDVHYHVDPVWADKYLAEQGTNIENQLQKELGHVKKAREAVLEQSGIYLRLLDHEKQELVVTSVTLLSELIELSEDLFSRFKQLYVEDNRLWTRNSVLHGIRKLNVSAQSKSNFFEPIFEQEEDRFLRSAAALGAFEAQQSNYRSDIFDYLVDFCRFLEQETEYGWLKSDPWGGPSINIHMIMDACLSISSRIKLEEVKRIALVMDKPDNVFGLIEKLFFKFFSSEIEERVYPVWSLENGIRTVQYSAGKFDNVIQLTESHQSVPREYKLIIELILQLDKFWEVKSNMLHIFGLPHSRDELRKLI